MILMGIVAVLLFPFGTFTRPLLLPHAIMTQ
jgi:hypothetical protein